MPNSIDQIQSTGNLQLLVNGNEFSVACTPSDTFSIADLLQMLGFASPHFAIAVNLQFVPRTQHDSTQLHEGDCVEILAPMQGG
jgi:sulfur carrier protein